LARPTVKDGKRTFDWKRRSSEEPDRCRRPNAVQRRARRVN